MKKSNFSGMFIAFEGLDGSGSSTQVGLLTNKLKKQGYKVFATKEPTNNIIGGLIRGQLTHDWKSSMECLQLLFAADRAHHLHREIIPAINDGKIIISDRYFFSTIAFGSIESDREWLLSLNERFILPDLTFLIKVPAKECLKRMTNTRFELELFEQEAKLKKVWSHYDWLSKNFANVYVIDGAKPIDEISKEIFSIVLKKVHKKFSAPNVEKQEKK